MKLLRVGQKGQEKPAALDKEGKIRDISSQISDLNPDNLNFETISKLQNADLSSLPEISSSERIGSCITKPGKFIAIGLNFSDHAAETGAEVPSEPITFMKATSCINGPNDDIEIVSGSKKLRLGSRIRNSNWKTYKTYFRSSVARSHLGILSSKRH